jgi:hypothetical protein
MISARRQADEHPITANHHRSQMKDYRTVETSPEVWAVIRARHPELVPFGTASFEGDMFTSFGFKGADFPLMEARTTWEIGPEYQRINEQHRYWLCIPIKEAT